MDGIGTEGSWMRRLLASFVAAHLLAVVLGSSVLAEKSPLNLPLGPDVLETLGKQPEDLEVVLADYRDPSSDTSVTVVALRVEGDAGDALNEAELRTTSGSSWSGGRVGHDTRSAIGGPLVRAVRRLRPALCEPRRAAPAVGTTRPPRNPAPSRGVAAA